MNTLALTAPLALLTLTVLTEPSKRAEIDFEHDLGKPVQDLRTIEKRPGEQELERIAAIVGISRASLAGLMLARGTVTTRRSGEVECVLVSLPFDTGFENGRITLAVGGGRIAGAGLWGLPEFDEDPGLVWSRLLTELMSSTHRSANPQLLPHDQLEAQLDEIAARTDLATRELLAISGHRTLMRTVNMQLRQFTDFMNGKGPVDAAWARGIGDEVRATSEVLLSRRGSEFEAPERETVESEYERLAAFYDVLPAKIGTEDELVPYLREQWGGGLCSRCHSTTTKEGVGWRDAAGAWRNSLGLPAGVLQVGYDVTPASGDDGQLSQVIADRFRAGYLLAARLE